MTDFSFRPAPPLPVRNRPLAVIDIGSNSIRMVVYDGLSRTPLPVFNEKAVCGLGSGLGASGRLNPDGVTLALEALARFIRLARAMNPELIDIVATAAVREASDGPDFVATIEKRFQVSVTILSGEQEARCAAQGVLCATPQADGLVADVGGGSLELVALEYGRFSGPYCTLPLGMLRLGEDSGNDRSRAATLIDAGLTAQGWIARHGRGKTLHVVGGAWRAVARLCITQVSHPLQVLDNFTLPAAEALRLFDVITRMNRKGLEKSTGLSRKRLEQVPLAALLLERLVRASGAEEIVFSVYGMREGRFFSHLPEPVRRQDPLLASCADWARGSGRFPEHGQELFDWMTPLFPGETVRQSRLRLAACTLGDVFWSEHPDYRAEQAFLRVFRMPFMGIGHQDRALLALALHARYDGDPEGNPLVSGALQLLSAEDRRHALCVGSALRLGHGLSGAIPGLLRATRLQQDGSALIIQLPGNDPAFLPEALERRPEKLARALGCDSAQIRRGNP